MELRKVTKISNFFVSKSFFCLLLVAQLPANGVEEQSGSGRPVWNVEKSDQNVQEWNVEGVVAKVGSNLTLSCVIDVLDLRYEVLKVSFLQGDALLPLVENGLVHAPFSSISRYDATLNEDTSAGVAMMISIHDIQPEDTGTFICYKHMDKENSAVLNVSILVPITDLYVTAIYPDGDEVRVDSESEIFLQEHDYYGVGCVATVEGSFSPPEIRILIDDKDETESFQMIHQVDYSILQSGLTLWNSHVRLIFVSAVPNPEFNEKQLKCIASQAGFPEVEASTRLVVQYAPLIQCFPERLVARLGTSVTVNCTIKSNPGSRIMWSSARGDLSNYPNVFFDETIISSDQSQLKLTIHDVKMINYQRYTLTAANTVASQRVTFELLEDPTILVERHREVESILPEEESIFSDQLDEIFPDIEHAPAEEDSNPSPLPEEKILPAVKRISSEATSSMSDLKNILFEDSTVVLMEKSTYPESKMTSPELKSTLLDARTTVPMEPSTVIHIKIPRNRHSTPSLETKHVLEEVEIYPKLTVASSSELEEPGMDLPVQPPGVHYSHSRSSSKKDPFKKTDSGKTSNSTSTGAISLVIQLLVLFSVIVGRL